MRRRVSRECPESVGETLSPSPCLLAVANHPRRLPHPHDDSLMGSTGAYPYSALLGGIRGRMPRDRHVLPLLGLMGSRYRGAYAVRPTPGRQALHLHGDTVIKEQSI
jgi:hypothetical protein